MRIGLLGPLLVSDEAGRPVPVGGSRVRLLLILLALDAGRVVPAYALIERLWDDEPPANAGNSLQSLVSRLRTSLRQAGLGEQVIESHPAGYRLAISPAEVDAAAFEDLARQGNRALAAGDPAAAQEVLAEALDAWRGPALADASAARFAAGPAARLAELRTRASLDLIEAGLALGESDGPIGELRAMIATDPVAERPRGLLMRALYAAGRQAEALAVYTETRELLASELGVDPSPQLEQIYLGVLRQDAELRPRGVPPADGQPAPAGAEIPSQFSQRTPPGDSATPRRPAPVRKPLTSFVGRDEDLARVAKMLAEGRLVTLTGPGGAGKTRLAVETARRLANPRPGEAQEACQVWLVELTPVTDPGELPYAVLHALGIRQGMVMTPAGGGSGRPEDPVQRLVTALAGRPGLLILDNCEHVVAAAAALAEQVLSGCPEISVLATSREPLRIPGETLWPVPPLTVPPAPRPGGGEVAGYAAVRLLADRASAVRPDFVVNAANAGDVARICRALDGMPLAIELAAARLRTLSAAQLAERLDARFELLTGGSRTAVPRHQTLRAVVDWSWELLAGPEQMLARRLAIFPAGATLTAAERVCQDAALPGRAVLPTLFGLVEKSFLTVDGDGEPRYRMLETLRTYCLERLAEAGEEGRTRQAFAHHFLDLAETAEPLLRTAAQLTWMRRLTAEQDNVHAALRWAVERRDPVLALRFGQALGWFWLLRGQRRESAALAMEILAVSGPAELAGPAADGLDAVAARAVCAMIAVNSNWNLAAVRQPLADAEPLLVPQPDGGGPQRGTDGDRDDGPAAGQPEHPAHPLVVVGVAMRCLYEQRDPDRALAVLASQFGSPDPWLRSGARLIYSFFSMSLGRLEGAAEGIAQALAGFEAIGDRWGTTVALMGQAELASLDGDQARVVAALERAIELGRELIHLEDSAQIYASLAKSRSRLGDFDGALADLAVAERVAHAQGESDGDLWVSYIEAELAYLRGDLATVAGICRRLDARIAGRPPEMAWSFRALILLRGALAELRAGRPGEGRDMLATALRLADDSQDRAAVASVIDAVAAAQAWAGGGPDAVGPGGAERVATLLGAAHSVRGAFDHSSLDAPGAGDAARRALGAGPFEAAYRRGRELGYAEALALARDAAQLPASG